MAKFKENELTEKLQKFKKETTIKLEFRNGIDGKIEFKKATAEYDYETGYINIIGENGEFKINTTMVYGYEEREDEIIINSETISVKIK